MYSRDLLELVAVPLVYHSSAKLLSIQTRRSISRQRCASASLSGTSKTRSGDAISVDIRLPPDEVFELSSSFASLAKIWLNDRDDSDGKGLAVQSSHEPLNAQSLQKSKSSTAFCHVCMMRTFPVHEEYFSDRQGLEKARVVGVHRLRAMLYP